MGLEFPEQGFEQKPVAALKYAHSLLGVQVGDDLVDLYQAATDAFNHVRWTEFYAHDTWSQPFLSEFANGEGIGPDGFFYHQDLILGLFILGPETIYPEHAHPAEEFYIVLSGNPQFKVGLNSRYETRYPGDVVLHHSDISHSIKSADSPFFAIFGWRGDINSPSWYKNKMDDRDEVKKYPKIKKS